MFPRVRVSVLFLMEYSTRISGESFLGRAPMPRIPLYKNSLADAGSPYDNSGAPPAISDLVSSSSSSPAGKSSEDVPISTILASSNINGEQSHCIHYA